MITTHQLADAFNLNLRIIMLQTEGLTHTDSLIQTSYNINCLNWVLGHIAVGRDRALRLLGEEPLLTEAETERYRTDSEPVHQDGKDVVPLERLLDVLQRGQGRISARLSQLSPQALLEEEQAGGGTASLSNRLHGLYFHETYHTGQTEIHRQIAGKGDKVI
jgi:hypothetical protein